MPAAGAGYWAHARSPAPAGHARQQICPHEHRVPVTLLGDGDTVAQLCLGCDAQLDADWVPRDWFCPYGELPSFPPVHELPPFVSDPRLSGRIVE